MRAKPHCHWTDRDDTVNYLAAVQWPSSNDEEDMEEGSEECARGAPKAIKLYKANATLISSAFTSVFTNTERRRIRDSFPKTELAETCCVRLDLLFRTSSVKQEAKTADAELAWVQVLIHDPMAPLIRLQHAFDDEDGKNPSLEAARSAVSDAIRLVGNTSAGISRLRHRKILKAINPDIQDLTDDDIFNEATPNLFGQRFEAKMKEWAEPVKLLAAARPQPPLRKFSEGAAPLFPIPLEGGKPGQRNQQPDSNPPTNIQARFGQRPSNYCIYPNRSPGFYFVL